MNYRTQEPDQLCSALMGTLLAGGVCLWLSNLTSGPEYGGAWDLPAVNYFSWFGFLLCMAAAIMVGVGAVLRTLGMGWERLRGGQQPE